MCKRAGDDPRLVSQFNRAPECGDRVVVSAHLLVSLRNTGRERDRGAFRPPTLRNVTRFPRLMHNGRLGMSSALDNYGRGGVPNRWLSPNMLPLPPAAPNTISELLEFLEALVGEWPEHVGPPE
jgi:cytochrome c peroxidase